MRRASAILPIVPIVILSFIIFPAATLAQSDGAEGEAGRATIQSLRGLHDLTMMNITRTAEMLDDSLYAYRPTEEVRSIGELLAHIADGQYLFCSAAAGEENPSESSAEETARTKEDVIEALESASAYCGGVYDSLTDATGAELQPIFGRDLAASAILAFNSAHNYEHYGNLVTYMRLNGITPPSSQQ